MRSLFALILGCSLCCTCSLDVLRDTSTVTFNASNLTIKDATLYSDGLKTEQVQAVKSFDEKAERVTVRCSNPLIKGSKAQLRVRYEAQLTGNMLGEISSTDGVIDTDSDVMARQGTTTLHMRNRGKPDSTLSPISRFVTPVDSHFDMGYQNWTHVAHNGTACLPVLGRTPL